MSSNGAANIATYQVDDTAPVGFVLSGASVFAGTLETPGWLNQLLFNASDLNVGEHTVVVVFDGNSTVVPFQISYFHITSLTVSEQESLLTQHSHTNHAVEEAVLGTLLSVLLLIAVIAILRHRRKMKQKTELKLLTASPLKHYKSDLITTPFSSKNIIVPSSKLESTAPVVNSGECDLHSDILN